MEVKNKKQKVILLDAHAIIHRAYHALPDFVSSKGEPTGALYGVSTMLFKIIEDLKPDFLIACFDLPKPTFRHVAYTEYKAGRKKADDALALQLSSSKEIFRAFGIPVVECAGFEADDIIGTLASAFKKNKNIQVVIASGDMDTMQLIDKDAVVVYTLRKGLNDTILYNEDAVISRYGFLPDQIKDYKGLAGDPSDNIPGIKGIGQKTATTLINEFGSVENIYKSLKKQKENFTFPGATSRITNLIKEGEEDAIFSKTLATIRCDAPIDTNLPEKIWSESFNPELAKEVFERFDFKSLRSRVDNLAIGETPSSDFKVNKNLPEEEVERKDLKELQVLTWLIDADKTNPKISDIKLVAGVEKISEAKENLIKKIEKKPAIFNIWKRIEQPLLSVVEDMYINGICVDTEYLKKLQKVFEKDLSDITKKIHKLSGKEFNISSPKQLSEVLFSELNLSAKGIKKTAGGAISTNIETLEKLKGEHEIIDQIILYRELEKIRNTYIIPLQQFVKDDGRVHSDFIQTGAATGRFSSLDPNMQNLPTTLEEGKNIRKAFVSKNGWSFVAFDYSQIELRIAAMLSKDEKLLEIFREGSDVHTSVAAQVFKVSVDSVTTEMRRKAKTINFGILYGMGVTALKSSLGGDRKEAQEFYDTYKSTYKTLAEYLEKVKIDAKIKGYTETLYGRRRPMPLLKSPLPFLRAQGERMAINAPIQGTDADIMRIAMVEVDKIIKSEKLENKAKILIQVHDEIVFEVENDFVNEFSLKIRNSMENIFEKYKDMEVLPNERVQLVVTTKVGNTLGTLKDL